MMAQQILLSSDKKRVTVSPGAKTEFVVTIQNLTTLLDDVAVTVAGIDANWVQVVPAHAPVFAQGEANVRVILQPPLDPSRSLAGLYTMHVSGKSQELPGQHADLNLELEIQFGGDYRVEIGQGSAGDGQEATFPFKVHNDANAPLALRFSGADAQNAFWYKFDPFQITVPPGGEAGAVLSIRMRQTASENQQIGFTLSTQGEWTGNEVAAITAPTHQVSGQWGQAAPTTLGITVRPSPPDNSGRARYQVVVNNPGANAEIAHLEGSCADGLLGFKFEPAELSLGPQSQAASNLEVWLIGAAGMGQQALDFWVTARPAGARTHPGSMKASFTLPAAPIKKRPNWLIPAIVIALLVLIVCVIGVFLLNMVLTQ